MRLGLVKNLVTAIGGKHSKGCATSRLEKTPKNQKKLNCLNLLHNKGIHST